VAEAAKLLGALGLVIRVVIAIFEVAEPPSQVTVAVLQILFGGQTVSARGLILPVTIPQISNPIPTKTTNPTPI